MALTLTAPAGEPAATTVQLVAAYCNVTVVHAAGTGAMVLKTPQGSLEGVSAACTYIAHQAPAALQTQLLGATPEAQAEIVDWMSRANTTFSAQCGQPQCAELNTELLTRTFLVGNAISLADLIVFGSIYPTTERLAPAELVYLCNLTRWTDFVYAVTGAKPFYKALSYKKPAFAPPAELTAAPKPAATAEGKGDKGDKGKGKTDEKAAKKDAKAEAKAEKKEAKAEAKDVKAEAKAGEKQAKQEAKEGDKKEKKEKKPKELPKAKEVSMCVSVLDIRVGTIVAVKKHPDADALYVEEIDVGEEKPRQVVSGLVKFVPEARMLGARVLVLCNLKPAKMRNVESFGMVLCTSNEEHTQVDLVVPPEGVPNGERITWEGVEGEPEAQLNPKKKQFETIAPGLKTDANGVPTFEGNPFKTSKGPCSSTMPNCHIK